MQYSSQLIWAKQSKPQEAKSKDDFFAALTDCSEMERWDELLDAAENALAVYPCEPGFFYYKSYALQHMNRGYEALEAISRCIGYEKSRAMAYVLRGDIYDSLGNGGQALADYNRAEELAADDVMVFINRAICYERQGRFNEAEQDFIKARQLEPGDVDIIRMQLRLAEEKDDAEAMLKYYAELEAVDILRPDDYLVRLRAWFLLGRFDKNSLQEARRVAKRFPNLGAAWFNLALFERQCDNPDRALKAITRSLELEEFCNAYWQRAYMLDEMERFAEALKDLEKALALQENCDWSDLFFKAELLYKLGRFDQMLTVLDTISASEIAPEMLYYYGSMLFFGGRWEQAVKYFFLALEQRDALPVSVSEVQFRLADSYCQLKRYDEAMTHVKLSFAADAEFSNTQLLYALLLLQSNAAGAEPEYEKALKMAWREKERLTFKNIWQEAEQLLAADAQARLPSAFTCDAPPHYNA